MTWVIWVSICAFLIVLIVIGILVLLAQKAIDAPERGLLLVDKQDEEGPAMVYLQALVDPGTFKDGDTVKLRVRIVKPDPRESQLKQARV